MDASLDPEELVRLRMQADFRGDLYPVLQTAVGATIDGFLKVKRLVASGRQSHVFLAGDLLTGTDVVVKQAAFDYRYPVRISRQFARDARRDLIKEARVLNCCRSGHLPQVCALLTASPIVAAASRCHALGDSEFFLVEEKIDGTNLRDLTFHAGRAMTAAERERLARVVAAEFVQFWDALFAAGWFYRDVSPGNLFVENETGRLRVVDAGSACPAADRVVLRGISPAFTTPNLFEAFGAGRPVAGTAASVLPALAKVLHVFLTHREPLNGMMPELDDSALAAYSPNCRSALAALLELDESPDRLETARQALGDWSALADS